MAAREAGRWDVRQGRLLGWARAAASGSGGPDFLLRSPQVSQITQEPGKSRTTRQGLPAAFCCSPVAAWRDITGRPWWVKPWWEAVRGLWHL